MAKPQLVNKFLLNNGVSMPSIGLGTYRIRDPEVIMKTIDCALENGYRMIDTAAVYGNEVHIGNALKILLPKYNLQREDLFITTKLSPSNYKSEKVILEAFQKSLDNLQMNYVDLYLIHFPGFSSLPASDARNAEFRNTTWSALTKLYESGAVKAIGVSNFTVSHLKGLMTQNCSVKPAVNQVEWHPYYYQSDLYKFCKENDIFIQAYCSLGGTSASNGELLQEPIVKEIARKHNTTCAQVLLVWALQQNVAIIPKSTDPERIKNNISLNFTLIHEELQALNALGQRNIKYAWDPKAVA